jgi:hypothetical protein
MIRAKLTESETRQVREFVGIVSEAERQKRVQRGGLEFDGANSKERGGQYWVIVAHSRHPVAETFRIWR